MGEHKFVVGMRAGLTQGFPHQDILESDVVQLISWDGLCNWMATIERTGKLESVWDGFLKPIAPADPPSVGVPGPRPTDPASQANPQQQSQPLQGIDRTATRIRDLEVSLEAERRGRKQFGERVCELQRELAVVTGDKFRHGDILGDNAELRREKADLETQVAYLTRELVLAKGKLRWSR